MLNPEVMLRMLILGALCLCFYLLGQSTAEKEASAKMAKEQIKKVELIKYVSEKKSQIWAAPHAGRAELLKLMRDNKL